MSDVSRGPGWWRASDGKWYPPESHAQSQPARWLASDGQWYPSHVHPNYRRPASAVAPPSPEPGASSQPVRSPVRTAPPVTQPVRVAPPPTRAATDPTPKAWQGFSRLPRAAKAALLVALAFPVVAAAANNHGTDAFETVAAGPSTTAQASRTLPGETDLPPTSTGETTQAPSPAESASSSVPDSGKDGRQGAATGSSTTPTAPGQAASAPAPAPTQAPAQAPPASTSATVPGKSPAEWAQPALPYHSQLVNLFDAISAAASKLDLTTVQRKSGELADAAHNLRSALESSGPPPPPIAVEGPAVMAAASDLERNGRTVAGCNGPSDCTAALKNLNTASLTYLNAVQALLKKV